MQASLKAGLSRFVSSTFILAFAVVLHATRVIFLSLILDDHDFGVVSTILLVTTIFADFGSLGFSQLAYNVPPFSKAYRRTTSHQVNLYIWSSLAICFCTTSIVSTILVLVGQFGFVAITATLFCAGVNIAILSSLRSAANIYIYPIAFAIKALIIMVDIVILSQGSLQMGTVVLWGEILSVPVLLAIAAYVGVLKFSPRLFKHVRSHLARNIAQGIRAISSSSSAMMFFNIERIVAAIFLSTASMGLLTKMLMPKIIASQSSFLLAVHFHRFVTSIDTVAKADLLLRIRRIEPLAFLLLIPLTALGGFVLQFLFEILYGIETSLLLATSISLTSLIFLFNPFSIFLQATGQFLKLLVANIVSAALFALLYLVFQHEAAILYMSAAAASSYFLLTRYLCFREAKIPSDARAAT